ncbi:MAG TPA: hypothetical protein PK733_14860 [Clostridiales bacterium]|nr:hypothetical protein [Clostridiales bacterium]
MAMARDVENYEKAYIDRRKDFTIMRKGNRKVMTMYLGGIYLECLLKTVIIKKNKIEKSIAVFENRQRIIYWYSNSNYEKLKNMGKVRSEDYNDLKDGFNPEHNLILALKQIDELNTTLPAEGVRRLEMLNKPVNNQSFTSLRYTYDEQIPDSLYNEWEENFIYFMNFFNRMKKTLIF